MARCTNCGSKWKAKDIWKLGAAKDGKNCPSCGTRQYVSFKNGGFLMGLGYVSGTIGLLLIVLFPYYIHLSNRKEKELYGE
ncbi:hypothetical protein [Planococcus maitriensis]|uniref:CXXC-20-CXXC protein n=1 Tax=Planococcus maitriensis TaxID=221799 RepID=A0A365K386_9BACL|nr:hypothetical protein [Planococcus maitriensis]RAZ67084.1 hypothetical protein DP119_12360 [Planococcus maitriensis]